MNQHPTLPNVLFAGTASGLLRSNDSGTSWRRLSSDSTRSLAFDPAAPGRIFIATDEAGLFRSDDLGDVLVAVNKGFCNRNFTSLVGVANTLFLGMRTSSSSVILERETGDAVWNETTPNADLAPSGLTRVLYASRDGRTILANTEEGIYRTLNAGKTWEMLRAPLEMGIYAIVGTGSNGLLAASSRGLLKSEDLGKSWTPVSGALAWGNVRAICKHPARPEQLFASRYGMIFRTRNGGVSWTPFLPANQSMQTIQALVVALNPECLYVLIQNRGVYRISIAED